VRDFRFGSKADIGLALVHVRFTPESGHQLSALGCPLSARSGHRSNVRFELTCQLETGSGYASCPPNNFAPCRGRSVAVACLRSADDGVGFALIPNGLADRWRDRPIAEIDGDDIHAIVEEVRGRGIPGLERRAAAPSETQARAMFAVLNPLFGWLVEKRRLKANPCLGVARPETPRARERVLSNAEIVAFWRAADAERKEFAALLKLLLLTGCRLSEVAQMRRAELNEDGVIWTIPGERTKNRRTHVVPLPRFARDILATVPTVGDLVFTTDGIHPISGWSKIKRRLDTAIEVAPWRLHDIRRSCATGMAEIGVAPHIVEAVLNHISGHKAGVAGIYNRAAYASEKKAALERWAAHIENIVSGKPAQNILTLTKRGGNDR